MTMIDHEFEPQPDDSMEDLPHDSYRGPCPSYRPMSMSDWCDNCGYPRRVHPQFSDPDAE